MANRKNTGSYYTPSYLSNFIVEYLAPMLDSLAELSILEPSAGDRSFVKAFNEKYSHTLTKEITFHVVEKLKSQLEKAKQKSEANEGKHVNYSFEKNDFLKFQQKSKKKFSCILGNPPYIKKSLLNKTQISICKEVHKEGGFLENSVRNIWTAFLISACKLLTDDGVLGFVLPSELLQVKFSVELRAFLMKRFERVEIFTFDDLLFECKGQDTVLLFAYKKHNNKGQYYAHIGDVENLQSRSFTLKSNNVLIETKMKWTHHSLPSDDIEFIHNVRSSVKNVDTYCTSAPGIVTAGNSFFIVNEETVKRFDLTNFVKPIIQKATFVNGSVCFTPGDYDKIIRESKPAKLLILTSNDMVRLPRKVKDYLKVGIYSDLPNSYKCSRRNHWYIVPNIGKVPQGLFFRRIHQFPKLLRNDAKVLVTDSAYKVDMRNGNTIDGFIFSFYNSLTLAFAELNGRYYGGGVLELTPSEFKGLPIPLLAVDKVHFQLFNKEFSSRDSLSKVTSQNDYRILNSVLGLNREEIDRIRRIHAKLLNKRFRKGVI